MNATPENPPRRRDVVSWIGFAVSLAALLVCAWVCLTEWGGVVHGHPAYAVWLAVTVAVAAFGAWWSVRPRTRRRGAWRLVLRIALIVLAAGWIALTAWLRPHTAVEPALAAMQSDGMVTVDETATEIVMTPRDGADATGVLFQPGALVDPRAYAAVLRPLAEEGHTVVIAKQPLGIAFFALAALDAVRAEQPDITQWVVSGHSLGGTVASMEADGDVPADAAPVVGLLLYASYPATDISGTLDASVESISGSRDGLATPAKIDAAKPDLPGDTHYTVVDGASHAQFGDYGPQPGDNTPTISHDDARTQISSASVAFVNSF